MQLVTRDSKNILNGTARSVHGRKTRCITKIIITLIEYCYDKIAKILTIIT